MAFTREDISKLHYTTGEVAELFQVSVKTIQKWDNKGILKFERSPTNRRVLSKESLIDYLKSKNMFYEDPLGEKRDVIYARVSTLGQQKQGDLDRQVDYILSRCSDLKNVLVMKELGSGLNSERKKMLQLLDLIMEGKVNRIFVTYKERLTRFGFEYIESVCRHHGVEIVVMNDTIQKTVSEELAEDIMMLLASFSGKMYGLRSHKNKKGLENE